MKKFIFFRRFCILIILVIQVHISAESFKLNSLVPVDLTDTEDIAKTQIYVNDALLVKLPENMTYISGIEVNLKIPEEIASFSNFLAYSLYSGLKPAPSEKNTDYSGKKLSAAKFSERLTLNLYIPLSEEFSIKDNPYSEIINTESKPLGRELFIRFYATSKKVPKRILDIPIEVSARTVIINKGLLNLNIKPDTTYDKFLLGKDIPEKDFVLSIDETQYKSLKNIYLPAGKHHAVITSNTYRNEIRTFIIEAAKTTDLTILLRSIEPKLQIICPEKTEIFLDNKPIEQNKESFTITQGEHIIKLVIGDYEVVKNIIAVKGHSYIVNTNIDVSVTDED